MDGKFFHDKTKPPASSGQFEEVIFLTNFIFDLQRFAGTTWLLSADPTTSGDANSTTYTYTLKEEDNESNTFDVTTKTDLTDLLSDPRVAAGDKIKLNGTITTSTTTTISKDLTIDLKSFNWTSSAETYAINVTGRTLTVKGDNHASTVDESKISTSATGNTALIGLNGGSLILQDGILDGQAVPAVHIKDENSTFTATGGRVTGTNSLVIKNETSNIIDKSNLADQGGLYNLNIDGGNSVYFTSNPATAGAVASIGSGSDIKYYTTLQNAIDAASNGDEITLLNDVTLTDAVTVDKQLTLELAGKKITRTASDTAGAIKVTGDLTLTSSSATTISSYDCTIRVDGGTFKLDDKDKNITVAATTNDAYGIWAKNSSTLTLNGGIVNTSGKTQSDAVVVESSSTATISGSQITGGHNGVDVLSSAVTIEGGAQIVGSITGVFIRDDGYYPSASLPLRTLRCHELLFIMIDDGINPLGRVILVLSARESADGTEE